MRPPVARGGWEGGTGALLGAAGRADRLGDVLEPVQARLAQADVAQPPGALAGRLADEHLAAAGRRAQARGEVDGRPVPVAVALDRRAGVDAHARGREAGHLLEGVDDAQARAARRARGPRSAA